MDATDLHCLHAENQLRRRQWRTLFESGSDDPGAVAAVLRADDPRASMTALKAEFGDDFTRQKISREARENAVTPQRRQLADLIPPHPDSHRLDRFRQQVAAGVQLAAQQQEADVLALTALEVGRPAAPQTTWQVAIPTLGHPGTRNRLHLAGQISRVPR